LGVFFIALDLFSLPEMMQSFPEKAPSGPYFMQERTSGNGCHS